MRAAVRRPRGPAADPALVRATVLGSERRDWALGRIDDPRGPAQRPVAVAEGQADHERWVTPLVPTEAHWAYNTVGDGIVRPWRNENPPPPFVFRDDRDPDPNPPGPWQTPPTP